MGKQRVPGAASLPLADRATIANMAPEYGATMGFFPVDDQSLQYLRQTGRSEEKIKLAICDGTEQRSYLAATLKLLMLLITPTQRLLRPRGLCFSL